jgi:Flp pilus assembly protein TadD
VTALYQLSDYYKEIGRIPEQVALLRRLVRIDPKHEQALNNLAIARYQLGDPPETLLADFRAILAINPNNVKALQNLGFLLIATGGYVEAIETLERAVAVDPGYCKALNNLGRAYLARGDRSRGKSAFERAAACDPDQQEFRRNLDLVR